MNNEDQTKLEGLNQTLYSQNAPSIRSKRRLRFQDQDNEVAGDWDHIPEPQPLQVDYNQNKKMSFLTKLLIVSIIFFVIALGIGAFLVFNGANIVSANNVDININGPVTVSGGEPTAFEVQVSNHNNITLENINMNIDFPAGTTNAENSLIELKNLRTNIDNISPGGIGQKNYNAIFYGEENSKKEIKVSIEYHVKGSNAVFTKEKTFEVLISTSPLTLSVNSFKEVNSGQEFDIAVNINSNSKEVIKNLILKAVYPFGFKFNSSDLKALTTDNTVWKIGDIPPGAKKVIHIKGQLDGQDDEVRAFRFTAGTAKIGNDKLIGTEFITTNQEVSIKKPFMTVDISVQGDNSEKEYIGSFDNAIVIDLNYFNNLQTAVTDAEIHVKLSGSTYDKNSVQTNDGLYRATDNEIVWNGVTTSDLRSIEAGGSGRVSFSIIPRDFSNSKKIIINPDLKFTVSVNGKRIGESNVPEKVVSTAVRDIKVSSKISLGGQTLRTSGAFANTGPIPPKAENETTYTIVWTVDNTTNNISNAQVVSSLPPYVKWLNKFTPNTEDISYDSSSGQLVWNVGSVGTYTAGSSKRRQVSFQISLNPSVTQIGSSPVLVNQTTLTAQDDFTGETLKSNLGTLSTRYSSDPSFKDGDEKVIK